MRLDGGTRSLRYYVGPKLHLENRAAGERAASKAALQETCRAGLVPGRERVNSGERVERDFFSHVGQED